MNRKKLQYMAIENLIQEALKYLRYKKLVAKEASLSLPLMRYYEKQNYMPLNNKEKLINFILKEYKNYKKYGEIE